MKIELNLIEFNSNSFGGGGGIRTPVPVKANGFQDRLVVTASIRLRAWVEVIISRAGGIVKRF